MSGQSTHSPAALACAHGAWDQIRHVIDALEVASAWHDDPLAAVAGTAPIPWSGPVPDKHGHNLDRFAYQAGRELAFKALSHMTREVLGKGYAPRDLAEFLETHPTAHGLLKQGASMMGER